MGLEIYKKNQGVWARSSAYLLGAALILFGAWALYGTINVGGAEALTGDLPLIGVVTYYKAIALLVAGGGLFALHWLLNKPRAVDQLLEAEPERRRAASPPL